MGSQTKILHQMCLVQNGECQEKQSKQVIIVEIVTAGADLMMISATPIAVLVAVQVPNPTPNLAPSLLQARTKRERYYHDDDDDDKKNNKIKIKNKISRHTN